MGSPGGRDKKLTYGLAQHAFEQPAEQDFFVGQQDFLLQSVLHEDFAQQDLAQSAEHPPPVVAQELRAKAETATTDINDRFWNTFFIDSM